MSRIVTYAPTPSTENSADGRLKITNANELFSALTFGSFTPSQGWQRLSFRLKFLLRSILHYSVTRQLLEVIASHPLMHDMLNAQPSLPCKLHRPYLSINFSAKQSLEALIDHYDLIYQYVPTQVLSQFFGKNAYTLSNVLGKHEKIFTVGIQSREHLNKEGELTIILFDAEQTTLAQISFILMNYQNKRSLFIGGLQGANAETPHSAIQAATKGCHGLFPKRIVLESVYAFAKNLGCQQIIAVGNKTHIYQNWRYYNRKKRLRHADYDAFWLSLGAKERSDGTFELPLPIARKNITEIPSKKRAEYQRRYHLLEQIQHDINQLVA